MENKNTNKWTKKKHLNQMNLKYRKTRTIEHIKEKYI